MPAHEFEVTMRTLQDMPSTLHTLHPWARGIVAKAGPGLATPVHFREQQALSN